MSDISRSEYQKVVEENKRLLADLRTICYDKVDEDTHYACIDKWYEYFRKQEEDISEIEKLIKSKL